MMKTIPNLTNKILLKSFDSNRKTENYHDNFHLWMNQFPAAVTVIFWKVTDPSLQRIMIP